MQYYDDAAPALPFAYASWGRRIASAVIDLMVLAVVSLPFVASILGNRLNQADALAHATSSEIRTLTVVSILLQIGYFTAMHAWRGSTVGKMATRTVVVRDDGSPVTPAVAFVRAVTLVAINFLSGFLILIPAVVNMLRPLWSARRQTWHDQIAHTVVVLNTPR